MQRHHLLPRQLLACPPFSKIFDAVGRERIGFDDFRHNGLLLPALEQAALVLGLPLHRGPHRRYNELVIERVGQIEAAWSRAGQQGSDAAAIEVLQQMRLLQASLRRNLLKREGRKLILNSRDPLGTGVNFAELDAMADGLWRQTMVTGSD